MIFKIKSKMKHLFHCSIMILLVLLFAIRIDSQKIDDKSNSELEPSDLMPGGVDLNRFIFLDHRDKMNRNQQANQNEQFVNLVNSNDKTALPLKSSNDNKNKETNMNVKNFQQIPNIVFENVYQNDLTKSDKVNSNNFLDDQTFTNYLPDSNPINLVNSLKQLMPTSKWNSQEKTDQHLTQQWNQQLREHISQQINEHIDHQKSSIQNRNSISQLDSKISLNDMLDQLNIQMGSNLGYMRKRQRGVIRNNPGILHALEQGIKLSLSECKYQFKENIWNCPTNKKMKGNELFGKIVNRAYRETAYLQSIRSAGITYAITRGCSDGLIQTCSCDYRQNIDYISDSAEKSLFASNSQSSNENHPSEIALRLGIGGNVISQLNNAPQEYKSEYTHDFEWSGCSDNIKFAFKKAKLLLEHHLKGLTSSTQDRILIHNYEAGRRAVKDNMILVCKCHGLSGTCTWRTCWRRLSSFRKVGNYLKDRYNGAIQVIPTNDGESLIPKDESISPPSNKDLFFSDSSPDFCTRNLEEGSLGTSGRQCDLDSSSDNNCDQLCCGRKYRKTMKIVKYNCNCRFKYCCDIKCDLCKKSIQVYECE